MFILFFTLFFFLFLSSPVLAEHQGTELVQRNGLYYYPSHDDPVNGRVVEWHSNGQVRTAQSYKEGERDGIFTEWDEQGNITKQITYKNKQKIGEQTYRDGKLDGPFTEWNKHGQKEREGTYKDDKLDDLWLTHD